MRIEDTFTDDARRAFGKPCGLVEVEGCRWPISEGLPHMFCNAAQKPGRPYCPRHVALSLPPQQRHR
jgi:hypothetical protein